MCFNTQPPEGGWTNQVVLILAVNTFQHTAARRRLVKNPATGGISHSFQHTAARRRLDIG